LHNPRRRDCPYQLVIHLQKEDGRTVLAAINAKRMNLRFAAADSPPDVRPALRKFVPADPHWVYEQEVVPTRIRQLFLDAGDAVALVNLATVN
jgi:hypothetical protein